MRKLSTIMLAATLGLAASPALAQDNPKTGDRTSGARDDRAAPDQPATGAKKDQGSTKKSTDTSGNQGATSTKSNGSSYGVSYPGKTSEINKHIAFVNLYLDQAITNAKALSTFGESASGKKDNQLVQEARRNLDTGIEKALAHLKDVRGFKADLAMVTPGIDSGKNEPSVGGGMASGSGMDKLAKLDELERHLKEAKLAAKKLTSAKAEEVSSSIDAVSTHLAAAHETFRDVAKWTSFTLLEDTNLSSVPVRGTGTGAGDIERGPEKGSSPGTTTPDMTSPSITTPGTTGTGTTGTMPGDLTHPSSKGQTVPGTKPEPVKSVPGGGY